MFSGCTDSADPPAGDSVEPTNTGGDTDGDTGTDGDTDADADGGPDSGTDSDTGTGNEDEPFFSWIFDSGWVDYRFPNADPPDESSFDREFYAADWRGATAIDIVVKTLQYTTGHWRVQLDTGYAWTPCIADFPHPETAKWTTLTFDIAEICGTQVMLDITQALIVGVETGEDASAPETVQVAVDSITVR